MKLQQLRYIWEVAHHELNVSVTAQSLYTSQPGISKQIRLLEDELGIEIFSRSGKHLKSITPAGKKIIQTVGEILRKVEIIKQTAQEFSDKKKGSLSIATTYLQARYALPQVISSFMEQYPEVNVSIHQDDAQQVFERVSSGKADFALVTDDIDAPTECIMMPCYKWKRCLLLKKDHPLTKVHNLTLNHIAQYNLILYTPSSTGQKDLEKFFMHEGLIPKIILTAADSEIIKTYVKMGFGIGISAEMSYDPSLDHDLLMLPVDHILEPCTAFLGFKKGLFLRAYMYDLINQFAPHLTKELVKIAIKNHGRQNQDNPFATCKLPVR